MPIVKELVKIGNSYGVILDKTLLDLTHIKPSDEKKIWVELDHKGNTITIKEHFNGE